MAENEGGKGNGTKNEDPFHVLSPVLEAKPYKIVIQVVVIHPPNREVELKSCRDGEGEGTQPGNSP